MIQKEQMKKRTRNKKRIKENEKNNHKRIDEKSDSVAGEPIKNMNVDRALQEAEEPKNKGRYKCSRVFGCLGRMFSFPLLAVLLWFWFVPVAVAGCSPTNSTSDPTAINSPSLPTSLLDLQFGLSLNGSRGVGGQSNGSEVAALGCDKFASFAAAVGTAPWPGNNLSFGASWQFTGDGWFDPSLDWKFLWGFWRCCFGYKEPSALLGLVDFGSLWFFWGWAVWWLRQIQIQKKKEKKAATEASLP